LPSGDAFELAPWKRSVAVGASSLSIDNLHQHSTPSGSIHTRPSATSRWEKTLVTPGFRLLALLCLVRVRGECGDVDQPGDPIISSRSRPGARALEERARPHSSASAAHLLSVYREQSRLRGRRSTYHPCFQVFGRSFVYCAWMVAHRTWNGPKAAQILHLDRDRSMPQTQYYAVD
jgi:hypothetical protein